MVLSNEHGVGTEKGRVMRESGRRRILEHRWTNCIASGTESMEREINNPSFRTDSELIAGVANGSHRPIVCESSRKASANDHASDGSKALDSNGCETQLENAQ